MKSAVFYEPHVPITVEELDLEEPRPGEVMVDVMGAGVCHSDYHFVDGHLAPPNVPYVLGHEGAGVVSRVGSGVNRISVGDKVVLSMDAMCGFCRNCSAGSPTLCETYGRRSTAVDGTMRFSKNGVPYHHGLGLYSERTVVPQDTVVKVRGDAPLEKVCLIGCAVITGVGAVINRARVAEGSTMVVFGCGGVGLNVVQGGVLASASKIIAVDKVDFRLEKADELGATHLINAGRENVIDEINRITGGGADYAFEVVGFPEIVHQAFLSVRPGGTVVVVGVQPTGSEITVDSWELLLNRTLMGNYHGAARPRIDFPLLVDLYMDGRLKLDELITRYRPLMEINDAFDDMNKGVTARTVITFE